MSYRKLIDEAAALLNSRKEAVLHESQKLGDLSKDQLVEQLYNLRLGQHSLKEGSEEKAKNDALIEQILVRIDELSKSTLASYVKKASDELPLAGAKTRQFAKDAEAAKKDNDFTEYMRKTRMSDKAFNQSWKRRQSIAKAVDKIVKESVDEAFVDGRDLATQMKMKPDMAKYAKKGELFDFYHPSNGDKVQGKVISNDGKRVVMYHKGQRHNFTISDKLDESSGKAGTGWMTDAERKAEMTRRRIDKIQPGSMATVRGGGINATGKVEKVESGSTIHFRHPDNNKLYRVQMKHVVDVQHPKNESISERRAELIESLIEKMGK